MKNAPRNFGVEEGKIVISEEFKFPKGVSIIDRRALYKNEIIRKVVFPYSLTKIGPRAFQECSKLEEVHFSKWFFLYKIGMAAFEKCNSLKEISLPDSVSVMEDDVFYGCERLEKVKLPKGLKTISEGTFKFCKSLHDVTLPKKLKEIEASAFSGCKSLKKINLPKTLKRLGIGSFMNCSMLESVELPEGLEEVKPHTFSGCTRLNNVIVPRLIKSIPDSFLRGCKALTQVTLPKGLTSIEYSAFEDCVSLEKIELPEKLLRINSNAFYGASKLKEIILPEGLLSLSSGVFTNCISLENISLPANITQIPDFLFKGCTGLKEVKFPADLESVGFRAFSNCEALTRLEFPKNVRIGEEAFRGCSGLEEIVFDGPVESIKKNVFLGCDFKYVYKLKGSAKIIYSKTLPTNVNKIENIIEVSEIESKIEGFDISQLAIKGNLENYKIVAEKLERVKTFIPFPVVEKLNELNKIDEIGKSINFKFFNGEIPDIKQQLIDKKYINETTLALYKFAFALGCFSTEKMVDKNGNPTSVVRGQKASTFIGNLLRTNKMRHSSIVRYFQNLTFDEIFSQEFLNFITTRADGKTYNNWELLTELENKYPGIIMRVARNFNTVESLRVVLDSTGRPQKLSWKEALIKLYNRNRYENITEETREIADLFADKGVEEEVYELAVKIHKKAKQKGIKPHILNVHLKEETILEKIENIKKSIDETLLSSKTLIEELYEKKFTFEFLSKHDPHNAIMGIFCSCCGSISSCYYGKDIAEASIVAKDVQNLVVRDAKGQIVAKGTMYVSPTGYAVINDIEINDKYKKHETYNDGYYADTVGGEEENDRELIFKAFMRGVNAFVKQYDIENPKKPIKKVNVGMGYNRLKKQCARYREETKLLKVPGEYSFMDAREGQWILYERGEGAELSGGQSK